MTTAPKDDPRFLYAECSLEDGTTEVYWIADRPTFEHVTLNRPPGAVSLIDYAKFRKLWDEGDPASRQPLSIDPEVGMMQLRYHDPSARFVPPPVVTERPEIEDSHLFACEYIDDRISVLWLIGGEMAWERVSRTYEYISKIDREKFLELWMQGDPRSIVNIGVKPVVAKKITVFQPWALAQ